MSRQGVRESLTQARVRSAPTGITIPAMKKLPVRRIRAMAKRPTGPKPRRDLATGVSEASCFGGGAMASGAGGISTGGIVGPAMDTRGADRLFRLSCDVELVADGKSSAAGAPTR